MPPRNGPNVIVYVILIADRGFYGGFGMGYWGYSSMKKMAEETGGRLIDVGNNGKKLDAAFQQIEDELRTPIRGQLYADQHQT